MKRYTVALLPVLIQFAASGTPAHADHIRLLVEVGQSAPGLPGLQFSHIDPPALNNSRSVAFFARLSGPGVTSANDTSLWIMQLDDPTSLRLLLREGMPAPGTGANINFANLGAISAGVAPSVNDAGEIAFEASLTGPLVEVGNNRGVWVIDSAGTTTTKLLRLNDQVPDGTGDMRISSIGAWTFSSAGFAAVTGLVGTGVVTDSDGIRNDEAVVNGPPGHLHSYFAGANITPVPTGWPRARVAGSFLNPTINNAGQVAVRASVENFQVGPDANAVLRGGATSFSMVAYSGQPAPVAGYAVGPFVSGGNSRHPFIAEDGSVSFFSSLRCATGGCVPGSLESVLTVTPSGALAVGVVEDTPTLESNVQFSTFWNWPQASSGALAVRGWLEGTGTTSSTDDFIGLGSPGSMSVIARQGDAAPGTNFTFQYFDRPSVNPNRDMVFVAGVNSTPSTAEGIWRHTFGRLGIVVRDNAGFRSSASGANGTCRTIGDVLPLSETTEGTGGGDGQPRQFDRDGRVVFRAVSTEVNQYGIYVAEPVDAISAEQPIIYLNFNGQYQRRAVVRDDLIPNFSFLSRKQQLEWVSGSEPAVPLSVLSIADREEIARLAREMLCRSGVDIPVTLDPPSRSNNVVTVFFTPLGTNHCYLTGEATNGVPDSTCLLGDAGRVDQFNSVSADDVIVTVNDPLGSISVAGRTLQNIAKTVLHETGHTFGLIHINPFPTPVEIMDYDPSDGASLFTDVDPNSGVADMRRVEPPINGRMPAANAPTHNPLYHLRVFGLREDPQAVVASGTRPGSWDIGSAPPNVSVRGMFNNVTSPIYGLRVRTINADAPMLRTNESEIRTIVAALGDYPGPGGEFNFDLRPGTRFELIGSSQPGGPFDIYLRPTPATPAPTVFENLVEGVQYSGTVVRAFADGTSQNIGTFNTPNGNPVVDTDGDGVFDHLDNCTTYANANQRDTDNDGFGNRCDGDFNNDNIVNAVDQSILRARFMTNDPHADLNGDGIVNSLDLGLFKALYMLPPGPARTQ